MSPLPSLVLVVLTFQILWALGIEAEERRSDVRAILQTEAEPGFWPTRGRRGGANSDPGNHEEAAVTPPFWAHRGRELISQMNPCTNTQPNLQHIPNGFLYSRQYPIKYDMFTYT